ncbi:MAG: J domain-containing protein [Thermodesulfobacteriota bacterium]|nr:J domain-containing protein [Thermodesulfobacteriota bacterium]
MSNYNKYEEITKAREILDLPESATTEEIKNQYKALLKKWHPDVSREKKEIYEEMIRKITDAYDCIMMYCSDYKFSFSKEEVEKYISPEEWWAKRFRNSEIWSSDNSAAKRK